MSGNADISPWNPETILTQTCSKTWSFGTCLCLWQFQTQACFQSLCYKIQEELNQFGIHRTRGTDEIPRSGIFQTGGLTSSCLS